MIEIRRLKNYERKQTPNQSKGLMPRVYVILQDAKNMLPLYSITSVNIQRERCFITATTTNIK